MAAIPVKNTPRPTNKYGTWLGLFVSLSFSTSTDSPKTSGVGSNFKVGKVADGIGVDFNVGLGVGDGLIVGEGVGVGRGAGLSVGDGEGEGVGVGLGKLTAIVTELEVS